LEIAENFCREAGAQILLIEGPADSEPCETFRRAWRKPLAQIKSPRLDHLAGVLTEAAAYLGGDSGISHLAALCGAPTLAMFGPESEPDAWAPIGERAEWMKWDEGDGAARLMALAGKPD
jgi:ADP-heptose:LPS heptosyltransferase